MEKFWIHVGLLYFQHRHGVGVLLAGKSSEDQEGKERIGVRE